MKLSVTTNAQIVRKGLEDLAAEVPKIGRLSIYRAMETIAKRMRFYWTKNTPAELPSYKRTGDLSRGYTIEKLTNGYRILNRTKYTGFVVGNAYGLGQAKVHRYRHPLMRDVVDQEVTRLAPEIQNSIGIAARRKGF
jgi:hypothetical protein